MAYALMSPIPVLLDNGQTARARDRWQRARAKIRTQEFAVLNLALLGYGAAIAAAERRATSAVVLAFIAQRLQLETGFEDARMLEWFWRTVGPALETLGPDGVAEAQLQADQMSVETALDYASLPPSADRGARAISAS